MPPVFAYRGVDPKGKKVKGTVDAGSPSDARSRLKRDKIFVIEIKASSAKEGGGSSSVSTLSLFKKSVNVQELALATQQLSTLMNSNIPLVDSLTALVDQVDSDVLKRAIANIKTDVNEGTTLAHAMRKHPKIFNNLYVNMIHAGEASGELGAVLGKLAEFTENQFKLQGKIKSALSYPIFMLSFSVLAVFGIFKFVIPKLMDMFDSFDAALPGITIAVLNVSDFVNAYWMIIAGVFFFIFWLVRRYLRTPGGRRRFHAFQLRAPIFGPVFRMIAVSRFTNTLSTLLASGVPILSAMDIVKKVVGNDIIADVVQDVRSNLAEGDSVAEPLRRSGEFPSMVTHMIAVGEKSGELEAMLMKIAENYNSQVDNKVSGLTALIQPIMILFMVGIIGVIIVAVLLPIFQLTGSI